MEKKQETEQEKQKGIVYLVGAGPGDPELLTLKGKRILSGAETLVYEIGRAHV